MNQYFILKLNGDGNMKHGLLEVQEKIIPLEDRVLVKVDPIAYVTEGGIEIPGGYSESKSHLKGEVIATGPGRMDDRGNVTPTGVKPGDKIVFGKHAGLKINQNGEEHRLFHAADVLVVLDA